METVTILTPTEGTNRYGDTELDWSAPTETDVCAIVYPTTSSEDNENRSALITGLTVLFPDQCPPTLSHTSRVEARGETWEIDGDMGDWSSPWGWEPGHEVRLRRVQG
mgnify:CR=1 FL=1